MPGNEPTVAEGTRDMAHLTDNGPAEDGADPPPMAEQPEQPDPQRHEGYGEHANALAALRAQTEALVKEREAAAVAAATVDAANRHRPDIPDSSISGGADYGGGNHELIQQLLSQQRQQQHHGQQHPQSALQQLLSQQHIQREQHQQQQLSQLSIEEARRLLDHHQAPRGSVLSNLLSSQWLGASQMLQGQSGLSSHSIAAALRGENNTMGGGLSDVGDLQRLLHLQQTQGLGVPTGRSNHLASLLLGGGDLGGSSSNSNLSNAILQQLAGRGSGSGQPSEHEHLSLANAQSILGYGGGASSGTSSLANALYRQAAGGSGIESNGVPDALSLLARSMNRGDGNPHGFGGLHDRSDSSGRYN